MSTPTATIKSEVTITIGDQTLTMPLADAIKLRDQLNNVIPSESKPDLAGFFRKCVRENTQPLPYETIPRWPNGLGRPQWDKPLMCGLRDVHPVVVRD